MNDRFSERLNLACDNHPEVPDHGKGRQAWVKDRVGVSHEAARKWFAGETRPQPDKMKRLAEALDVDEAWLALGVKPDLEPEERHVRSVKVDGAVNAVLGLIQLNGGHCAFPDAHDNRSSYVDFYTIIDGSQYGIHISLAQPEGDEGFRFIVPVEYPQCTVIGVVHAFPLRLHLVNLSAKLIEKHKHRKGGYFEVTLQRDGAEYRTGRDAWPRINSFPDKLRAL